MIILYLSHDGFPLDVSITRDLQVNYVGVGFCCGCRYYGFTNGIFILYFLMNVNVTRQICRKGHCVAHVEVRT